MADMVQCKLIKNNAVQQAWIDKRYAVKDKYVKIKQDDGTWDDGWLVLESFDNVQVDSKIVNERSQDYKKTRQASDI